MQINDDMRVCDQAIIATANGNREALGSIYDLMARNIYVTALAITGNHFDAEDALQDTMIQIVRSAASYSENSNPRAWILTIARHRALDIVRRRKSTVCLEELPLCECVENDDSFAWKQELSRLLEKLDIKERQIIIFRLYHGLSYEEISLIMAISVTAAQKRYQRALKKLKNICIEGGFDYE